MDTILVFYQIFYLKCKSYTIDMNNQRKIINLINTRTTKKESAVHLLLFQLVNSTTSPFGGVLAHHKCVEQYQIIISTHRKVMYCSCSPVHRLWSSKSKKVHNAARFRKKAVSTWILYNHL